jgi:hypothetical protein
MIKAPMVAKVIAVNLPRSVIPDVDMASPESICVALQGDENTCFWLFLNSVFSCLFRVCLEKWESAASDDYRNSSARETIMRLDKFTTKFQQALADAQSLANGNDQQFIEPQHLLLALLNQDDGGTTSLLSRAGVNVPGLKRDLEQALTRLPKVEGHGGDVSVGRDLSNLLNLTDKEAQKRGDQFIASEMLLLALCDDKNETGRIAKQHGWRAIRWKQRSWPCAAGRALIRRKPKGSANR